MGQVVKEQGVSEREGMDMEDFRISKHAYDRMKERLGINKKAARRLAYRAFENGIECSKASGKLRRYLLSREDAYEHYDSKVIIYGDAVYCFARNHHGDNIGVESSLVTVLLLPNDLKKQAHNTVKRMKREA